MLQYIPEENEKQCLEWELKYRTELQAAIAQCYILDAQSYNTYKQTLMENVVVAENLKQIMMPQMHQMVPNINQADKEANSPLFKTYYLHNIPIDILKNVSGLPDVSGIYVLRDENDHYYVGQGVHCIKRCLDHFRGTPKDAVGKAYELGMKFILEDVIIGLEGQEYIHLDTLEKTCIQYYQAKTFGYNKTQGNSSHDVIQAAS